MRSERATRSRLVGDSPAMHRLRRFVTQAAGVGASVLVTGETGTGKTLVARVIHGAGPRRDRPFLSLNCAGIPESLFESELFGHERGAFTGAVQTRRGLFELAHGGTLFLDEVGELPASQQAKLLTVLEEHEVRRVGGDRPVRVDVRTIFATSRDLPAEMAGGAFRRDLFHRIAVLRCEIPPLRERPEDIPALTRQLLDRLGRKLGRGDLSVPPDALRYLQDLPWPGNVRELAHVLEAAAILGGGVTLARSHLEAAALPDLETSPDRGVLRGPTAPVSGPAGAFPTHGDPPGGRSGGRRYAFDGDEGEEREWIRKVLARCRGNRTRAARELGMARNTLLARIRKYDLDGS